jgi:TRAP-type transport system periplasmic protein
MMGRGHRGASAAAFQATRRALIAGSAATFVSVGLAKGPAKAAEFEFKCGSADPIEHPLSIRLTQMWEAVRKESGGRVHTQFFPNSALGGTAAMFTQLRLGALQFVSQNTGTLSSVVPVSDISYLGFAFKDASEAQRVMDGPLGAYVRQEAAGKGIHVLRSIWDSGMLQISSSLRPVRTPDDLQGFKIRVLASKIADDLFKILGSSPTSITLGEIYTALQTKIVDGTVGPLVTIATARWYEVQRWISLTNHAWGGLWLCANADAWNRLPSDMQAIIERNNTKYATLERRDTQALNASLVDKLVRQGIIMNPVDQAPFRALLHSYYEYWANAFGPTAWGLLQTSVGRRFI